MMAATIVKDSWNRSSIHENYII